MSGEIDIMETCGAFANGVHNQACGTIHWGAPEHVYKGSGHVPLNSDYTYFHTYAVDWEPGKMTWYYDGVAIKTLENWASAFAGASDSLSFDAPFDQPFYMLLNLAVDSGQFGGAVNKATFQDDINMYVDYVRVFQKSDGYADSVERTASGDINDDWETFAGLNQIADIEADNIVNDLPDGNVSGVETSADGADQTKWYLGHQNDATDATAESYTDADGKVWAKVGVNSKGSNDYSVQLIGHYDAMAGYLYEVSFDIYAEGGLVGKTVNCASKEWAGWSTYGIESFELQNKATHMSYLIDQTEDFEDCRIEFNLGAQESGTVYIGNVRVEIVDPSLISRENSRKPLADGNLIYNSSFDQGNHHLGYWTAGEGTTVEVPRYTTEALTDADVSVIDIASMSNYEAIENGVKYYERRAQLSAAEDVATTIYQTDLVMPADTYALNFDMYSEEDQTVTASIYTVEVSEDGETKTLGEEVISSSTTYKAASGVSGISWYFDTKEVVGAIENAALVLNFGEGANVQIDNVTFVGESLGAVVDKTPMDKETTWAGDGATVSGANGVFTVPNVTSGGTAWYAPQIISSDYALSTGKQYKMSFKYKMEGTSNNTFEYIVQENGGSWTVYVPVTKVTYDPTKADAEGYCSYDITFTAATSLNNVHTVFGLGNSAAAGACTLTFKDVEMNLIEGSIDGDDSEGGTAGSVMPGTFSVLYELDGGTNATSNPIRYEQKEGTLTFAAPTKDGYNFLGWTIGDYGTDYVTTASTLERGPLVLYANWQKKTWTAAPVIGTDIADKTVTYKDAATLTVAATVADEGTLSYQWYKNSTASTTGATAVSGATKASLTVPTDVVGTTYYYCVLTNSNAKATETKTATTTSKIAKVVVEKAVNPLADATEEYTKAIGSKAFTLDAAAEGTVTYSVTKAGKKVVTVSKTGKVTVKGIGTATITVTAAGNDNYQAATKKITITVTPKKAVLSSVKSKASKKITVKWKKDKNATGYIVQYATNKNFKNAKTATIKKKALTSTTLKKLKGNKKYYVRVCSYKKVGKKMIQGEWSKAKNVKVKK